LGFDVMGIDVSPAMIRLARAADPTGCYRLVADGDYRGLEHRRFDMILSAFAFDNIPGVDHRATILHGLRRLLRNDGRIVLVDCTPDAYLHEAVSFTTRGFPGNHTARSGDQVRAIIKGVGDDRPVVDISGSTPTMSPCSPRLDSRLLPSTGRSDETTILTTGSVSRRSRPWVIYVLKPA
jgi:ubiquinone/menaquinone biosynthesis C-methylase UbiE